MNQSSHIDYPTLTLFLYDVREELGQDGEKVQQNRHQFWRKIEPALDKDYSDIGEGDRRLLVQLEAAEKPEAIEVELCLEKAAIASTSVTGDRPYYALQMGDTYALRIESSGHKFLSKMLEATRSLESLRDLKKEIASQVNHQEDSREIQPQKQGTIGQTWLLWAKLPGNHPEARKIARECYKQLAPDHPGDAEDGGKGRLAGATFYECWHPPTDWQHLGRENWHLLILLFPPRQSIETIRQTMAKLYPHLTRLFCHRNKILQAYSRSLQIKRKLKADYIEIEAISEGLNTQMSRKQLTLEELQKYLVQSLELSYRYAKSLSYLENQGRVIQSNLINYGKQIQKIASLDADSQLEFLSEFANGEAENYRVQVEADSANFHLGLTLLTNIISSLRGSIEIQQATSDVSIVASIVAVGVGVVTSQFTSAVMLHNVPLTGVSVVVTSVLWLVLSLSMGVMAGAMAFNIFRDRTMGPNDRRKSAGKPPF